MTVSQVASDDHPMLSRKEIFQQLVNRGELQNRQVNWWTLETLGNADEEHQAPQVGILVFIAFTVLSILLVIGLIAGASEGQIFKNGSFWGPMSGASFTLLGPEMMALTIASALRYRHQNQKIEEKAGRKFMEELIQLDQQKRSEEMKAVA